MCDVEAVATTWADVQSTVLVYGAGFVLGLGATLFVKVRTYSWTPKHKDDSSREPSWGVPIGPTMLTDLSRSLYLYCAYSITFGLIFLGKTGESYTLTHSFLPENAFSGIGFPLLSYFSLYFLLLNLGIHKKVDCDMMDRVRSALPASGTGSVLSLSCNRGFTPVNAAQHLTDGHVTAVDPFATIVCKEGPEWAEENIRRLGLRDRITVVDADPRHLPMDEDSFDAVVWDWGISKRYTDEGDLPTLLAECARALKPKGLLLLFDESMPAAHLDDAGFEVVREEVQIILPIATKYQRTVRLCRLAHAPRWQRTVRVLPEEKASLTLINVPRRFYSSLLGIRVLGAGTILGLVLLLAAFWGDLALPKSSHITYESLNTSVLAPTLLYAAIAIVQLFGNFRRDIREQRIVRVREVYVRWAKQVPKLIVIMLLVNLVQWVPYLVVELTASSCAGQRKGTEWVSVLMILVSVYLVTKANRPKPLPRRPLWAKEHPEEMGDEAGETYALL